MRNLKSSAMDDFIDIWYGPEYSNDKFYKIYKIGNSFDSDLVLFLSNHIRLKHFNKKVIAVYLKNGRVVTGELIVETKLKTSYQSFQTHIHEKDIAFIEVDTVIGLQRVDIEEDSIIRILD